jgi:hypothetical protein
LQSQLISYSPTRTRNDNIFHLAKINKINKTGHILKIKKRYYFY